jgi:hypothetical protein
MSCKYLNFRNLGQIDISSKWIEEEIQISPNVSVVYNCDHDFLYITKKQFINKTPILIVLQENGTKFIILPDHRLMFVSPVLIEDCCIIIDKTGLVSAKELDIEIFLKYGIIFSEKKIGEYYEVEFSPLLDLEFDFLLFNFRQSKQS